MVGHTVRPPLKQPRLLVRAEPISHAITPTSYCLTLQSALLLPSSFAAAQVDQGQLALLADGAFFGSIVGQIQLQGTGQDGDRDGALGRVRSTTQVMPRQIPPASDDALWFPGWKHRWSPTSSAMMQRSPGWMAKRLRVITLSTRSVKMARFVPAGGPARKHTQCRPWQANDNVNISILQLLPMSHNLGHTYPGTAADRPSGSMRGMTADDERRKCPPKMLHIPSKL